MAYLVNLATSLSQSLNALRGVIPDLTLSAEVHVAARRGSASAARIERAVDTLFFFHDGHCRASWTKDLVHARSVLLTEAQIRA